eukprot:1560049-Prymnesium_polylepis.1
MAASKAVAVASAAAASTVDTVKTASASTVDAVSALVGRVLSESNDTCLFGRDKAAGHSLPGHSLPGHSLPGPPAPRLSSEKDLRFWHSVFASIPNISTPHSMLSSSSPKRADANAVTTLSGLPEPEAKEFPGSMPDVKTVRHDDKS